MFSSNQATMNWPPKIDESLVRDAPYQVLPGETPPPGVQRATPTKHQPTDGLPHLQPESSRVPHEVRGKSRPIPAVKKDPPTKHARTLSLNKSRSLVKPLRTLVPKTPSEQPVLIRAPDKYNPQPEPQIKPQIRFACNITPDNPPDLPEKALPEKPPQCEQCKQPTSYVREFTRIRPFLRC